MSGEEFLLKWNDHHNSFFAIMNELCSAEVLTDVTLSCGGQVFETHKLLLCVCSTYFRSILANDNHNKSGGGSGSGRSTSINLNGKHPIVFLKDVNPKHLEQLLQYMYHGEINVLQEDLAPLIETARALKVKGLSDAPPSTPPAPPPPSRPAPLPRSNQLPLLPNFNLKPSPSASSTPAAASSQRPKMQAPPPLKRGGGGGANGGAKLNQLANILNAQNNMKRLAAESVLKQHHNGPKVSAGLDFAVPGGMTSKIEEAELKEEQDRLEASQDGGDWGHHSDDQELSQSGSDYEMHQGGEAFQDSEIEEKDTILKVRQPGASQHGNEDDLEGDEEEDQVLLGGANFGRPILPMGGVLPSRPVNLKPEPVKRHECTFCGKRFPTPSKLQRHALVHTGEKPYSCSICQKGFTQFSHLKNHLKFSHSVDPATIGPASSAMAIGGGSSASMSDSQITPIIVDPPSPENRNSSPPLPMLASLLGKQEGED